MRFSEDCCSNIVHPSATGDNAQPPPQRVPIHNILLSIGLCIILQFLVVINIYIYIYFRYSDCRIGGIAAGQKRYAREKKNEKLYTLKTLVRSRSSHTI